MDDYWTTYRRPRLTRRRESMARKYRFDTKAPDNLLDRYTHSRRNHRCSRSAHSLSFRARTIQSLDYIEARDGTYHMGFLVQETDDRRRRHILPSLDMAELRWNLGIARQAAEVRRICLRRRANQERSYRCGWR